MEKREENPEIQWAIDLLTAGPDYELNVLSKYYNYIFLGGLSQMGVLTYKLFAKRPIWSGIQVYPMFFAVSQVAAHILTVQKRKREGLRDAILMDYIRKFPEDFKEPVKRTYNDIFHPWTPWR